MVPGGLKPIRQSETKINDLWCSGYCRETVEFAKSTFTMGEEGPEARVNFLTKHVAFCQDCTHANIMKQVEGMVAMKMGPDAVALFATGGDITTLGRHEDHLREAMLELERSQVIDKSFDEWMSRVARRREYEIDKDRSDL